jgi:hypothetical protein
MSLASIRPFAGGQAKQPVCKSFREEGIAALAVVSVALPEMVG